MPHQFHRRPFFSKRWVIILITSPPAGGKVLLRRPFSGFLGVPLEAHGANHLGLDRFPIRGITTPRTHLIKITRVIIKLVPCVLVLTTTASTSTNSDDDRGDDNGEGGDRDYVDKARINASSGADDYNAALTDDRDDDKIRVPEFLSFSVVFLSCSVVFGGNRVQRCVRHNHS